MSFRPVAGGATRALITPEGVTLNLELARGGQRVWAFLLDLSLMAAVLVALTIVASLTAVAAFVGGTGYEVAAVIWLLGFFVLRNLWFGLFECGTRAATPGKRLLGIRVAARDGGRLTVEAVLVRNALRELEFYLPLSFLGYEAGAGKVDAWTAMIGLAWSLIFVLFPLFNRDRLRVGDLLAGTWVLAAPRRGLGVDVVERDRVVEQTGFRFTDAQLDHYGERELQVLEGILRRSVPNPMRRQADDPILEVAVAIRRKIGWTAGGDDYALLAAFYAALRRRLESRLLLGRRRRDKHER